MVPDAARLIPKGSGPNSFYRLLCGRIHPCSGLLGELRRPFGQSLIRLAYRGIKPTERGPEADWMLTHPSGLRRHGEGYRPIKDRPVNVHGSQLQRRRGLGGARPLPASLRPAHLAEQGGYRTIGEQPPPLPTIVYCPHCGRPNHVAAPMDVDDTAERAV